MMWCMTSTNRCRPGPVRSAWPGSAARRPGRTAGAPRSAAIDSACAVRSSSSCVTGEVDALDRHRARCRRRLAQALRRRRRCSSAARHAARPAASIARCSALGVERAVEPHRVRACCTSVRRARADRGTTAAAGRTTPGSAWVYLRSPGTSVRAERHLGPATCGRAGERGAAARRGQRAQPAPWGQRTACGSAGRRRRRPGCGPSAWSRSANGRRARRSCRSRRPVPAARAVRRRSRRGATRPASWGATVGPAGPRPSPAREARGGRSSRCR